MFFRTAILGGIIKWLKNKIELKTKIKTILKKKLMKSHQVKKNQIMLIQTKNHLKKKMLKKSSQMKKKQKRKLLKRKMLKKSSQMKRKQTKNHLKKKLRKELQMKNLRITF